MEQTCAIRPSPTTDSSVTSIMECAELLGVKLLPVIPACLGCWTAMIVHCRNRTGLRSGAGQFESSRLPSAGWIFDLSGDLYGNTQGGRRIRPWYGSRAGDFGWKL